MAPPAGRCDHAAAASRRRSARLAALRTLPAPPTAVAPPAPRTTTTPCRRRRRLPLHFRRSDNQACLVSNLAHHQVVFVEAWPGTGRSSQVPRVLHAAGHGPVVCSQTYRIAAESAAAHAATNMRAGEVSCMVAAPPQDQVQASGAAVTYTTHQTLLHLLAADPLLARYGAVVVDEADDGMLLTAAVLSCVKAVVARRPELRLVICIHGTMFYGEGAINDFFPDAVHLWFRTMLGVLRFHDFLTEPVPVTDYVAASVHTVCSIHSGEPPGDVLVFLPTRADIESAERLLAARALPGLVTRCLHDGLAVVDLIGDVLSPAPDGKRKVVLANDVANSAVFVEGIKYIVDSGYLSTDNALPSLTTTAGASSPPAAAQMVRALKVAVRSGYHIKRRGNEGKCFCLYTTAECRGMLRTCWSSLRARTNDANGIAGVVLVLKHLGIISGSIESFNFVLPPRPETLERAVEVLEAAGAVGLDGEVTEEGRLMARQILATCYFYQLAPPLRAAQPPTAPRARPTPRPNRSSRRRIPAAPAPTAARRSPATPPRPDRGSPKPRPRTRLTPPDSGRPDRRSRRRHHQQETQSEPSRSTLIIFIAAVGLPALRRIATAPTHHSPASLTPSPPKRMDNREWMYTGHSSQGQVTNEWINKTDDFLERAFGEASKGASKILCPCSKCANRKRQTKEVMGQHLWKNGFTPDYTRWVYHGEADRMREEVVRQRVEDYDADAGVADMLDDTAATPSLSQIRARSMSASLAIRPRPYTTQHRMEALQAQLEEEKRRREELEARIVAEREAEQRRFAEILQYMQSLGAAQGMPLPPGLFALLPPLGATTPNQSVASNEVPHATNPSPNQSHWP